MSELKIFLFGQMRVAKTLTVADTRLTPVAQSILAYLLFTHRRLAGDASPACIGANSPKTTPAAA